MNRTISIGPLNSASQASAWAAAVRDGTPFEAFTLAFDGAISRMIRNQRMIDASDRAIPHYRLSPKPWRKMRVQNVLSTATHHLNESNIPLIGNPKTQRFTDELDGYRRRGVTPAVVFHGSDARDPQLSMDLSAHSYFTDADPDWVAQLRVRARRNREAVASAGLQTFVTTPDMLQHVSGSRLLPLTVASTQWDTAEPVLTRRLPRVLHRPASSGATKGSQQIMEVLDDLERRGLIEVVRCGIVPHHEMPSLFGRADFVIDQIRSGAYGVTAIEAMAAGRLVIANISGQTQRVMGEGLPIVDADPVNLRVVIEDLLSDLERARSIAAAGPSFVKRWHDGSAAAQVIGEWMENRSPERRAG